MTYEHPAWPKRHKATFETHELGTKACCECGWWSTAKNQIEGTRLYVEHVRTEREDQT